MEETNQKPLKRLSKKRKGFARDYALTGNATDAAEKNFDVKDRGVARRVGSELLTFPDVVAEVERQTETLKSALENQGVTPEKIAQKVDQLLNSEEYQAVDKGLSHATKIYGVQDEVPKSSSNTYNFIFNPEVQKNIKEIEEQIKAKLLQ